MVSYLCSIYLGACVKILKHQNFNFFQSLEITQQARIIPDRKVLGANCFQRVQNLVFTSCSGSI